MNGRKFHSDYWKQRQHLQLRKDAAAGAYQGRITITVPVLLTCMLWLGKSSWCSNALDLRLDLVCHLYIILLYTSGVKNITRSLTKKITGFSFFLLFVCGFGFVLGWGGRVFVFGFIFKLFGLEFHGFFVNFSSIYLFPSSANIFCNTEHWEHCHWFPSAKDHTLTASNFTVTKQH